KLPVFQERIRRKASSPSSSPVEASTTSPLSIHILPWILPLTMRRTEELCERHSSCTRSTRLLLWIPRNPPVSSRPRLDSRHARQKWRYGSPACSEAAKKSRGTTPAHPGHHPGATACVWLWVCPRAQSFSTLCFVIDENGPSCKTPFLRCLVF